MGVRRGGKTKGSRKRKANVWDDADPKLKRDSVTRDGAVKRRSHGSMMGQWKTQKIAERVKTRQFVSTVYDKKRWQREQYNKTWERTVNAMYTDKSNEQEEEIVKEETQRDDSEDSDSEADDVKHKSVFREFVDTFKPIVVEEQDSEGVVEKNEDVCDEEKGKEMPDEEQIAAMEKEDEEVVDEQDEEEDPYRRRFLLSSLTEDEVKAFRTQTRTCTKVVLPGLHEPYDVSYKCGIHGRSDVVTTPEIADKKQLVVRSRLLTTWRQRKMDVDTRFPTGSVQRTLFQQMAAYTDVFFAGQSYENTDSLRLVSAMHVLNHVLKARDTVVRNNERLKKREDKDSNDDKEYRDQGFCRARVLVLMPLRSAAVAFVTHLLTLLPSSITTFHNKERFFHEFGPLPHPDPSLQEDGKKEWQRVFESGNNDDCFQLGLSFSRKAMRFYSAFHQADVILASPLGLRHHFGDDVAMLDDQVCLSSDFLSSIEVCLVDSASCMMMQNLDHVRTVLQATNVPPKEARDADFTRLREWDLAFLTAYFRQTIVLAHGVEPALNALVNQTCCNLSGLVKFTPRYDARASISRVVPRLKQVFQRVDGEVQGPLRATDEVELRFGFFKKHIFDPLLDHPRHHVVVFIPSYLDYVRVRNLFHDSMNSKLIQSVQCCEYTKGTQVSRARTSFFHGQCHVMLYTERFHFYHQYHIRGVHHLIWYGLPVLSDFYPEMLNMVTSPDTEDADRTDGNTSIALFSRLDLLRMQRIVGNKRAERMCRPKAAKQTYLFC